LLYMLCWNSGYSGNESGIEFKSIHSHIHCTRLSVWQNQNRPKERNNVSSALPAKLRHLN
jgi:hypothetical protein